MSETKSKAAAPEPEARTGADVGSRTSQATIFIFSTSGGTRIRTAPQRLFAGPGHVEWTVVNLVDGSDAPVTISWPNGGPWGKDPIEIRENGCTRLAVDLSMRGRYKYVVSALGAQEDPEIEIPDI